MKITYQIVFPFRDDLPPVTGLNSREEAQAWIDKRRGILRDNGLNPNSELDVSIEKVEE